MRKIKFSYIYQEDYTGGMLDRKYTLDEMEKGNPARDKGDYFNGCSLVARRQYSGMQDTQGVEMYEGDIVTGKKRGDLVKGYLRVIDIHWFLHNQEDTFIYLGSVGDLKVIGNIYENPELLGESDG